MKHAIIYLHGFNSASLDLSGKLLTNKEKLVVLNRFCMQQQIPFCTPNVDYRNFTQIISDLLSLFENFTQQGYRVLFMGSSMGGFTSEYMAMKTQSKAIMINPAISPSELLPQFIRCSENFETKQAYDWQQQHCEQYIAFESELANYSGNPIYRTLLLDMADELLDSNLTLQKYQNCANVITYQGGSHGFEHIKQALPEIKKVIFS